MFYRLQKALVGAALFLFLFASVLPAQAQTPPSEHESLQVIKIDPPNWYATFPKPLLLVRGTGLAGATFTVSDKSLKLERVAISENGHWAQLWISQSPQAAETVQIAVRRGQEHTSAPFTFAAPRPATDGMAGFSQSDIMYLILTDRFADGDLTNDGLTAKSTADSADATAQRASPKGWHGGDLRGIEQHLDFLRSFGVTAVWPTPVYQNHGPEAYHGYHATDYYSVDEHYGSLADLQALAASLHKRGMKLILDTVPNHVGPAHPWVTDQPTPNWFHGTAARHIPAEFNFDALVNPHAPDRDRDATLHGWFVDLLPDMNTDDPVVAQYLRQNAVWWIEQTGADALRIDTFPYVNREFWHDFTAELKMLFPRLTEVGEVSTKDPAINSAFADGTSRAGIDTGLYTPFDFPLYHTTRDVFAGGQPFTKIASLLEADQMYAHPERLVPFLGNHDESRFAQAVSDPALRQVAYALLLTTRGTPQLYSGDEIGMLGGDDPDNRRDFPGGFPSSPSNAFSEAGRTPEQEALFTYIRSLTALRAAHPALACGKEQVLASGPDLLVYSRTGTATCTPTSGPSERLIVALQRGSPKPVAFNTKATDIESCSAADVLLGSANARVEAQRIEISATSPVAILACR